MKVVECKRCKRLIRGVTKYYIFSSVSNMSSNALENYVCTDCHDEIIKFINGDKDDNMS